MEYFGDVYRPPSEARSLIIQATLGCSNNTCAFCTMYKAKKFLVRSIEDVTADLQEMHDIYPGVRRIFLADGDALAADTQYLLQILERAGRLFPYCERITSYATPRSILEKSEEDLDRLRRAGLTMLYMGLESGDDVVLKRMGKGCSCAQIVEAGKKARRHGYALSVTAISGLGGKERFREHALETARALSEMNPEYIGLLTLLIHPGTPLERWVREGSFTLPDADEILEEVQLTVENIDSPGSIFRMNHASNYLALKGTLNEDRQKMIEQIEKARRHQLSLRPDGWRLF